MEQKGMRVGFRGLREEFRLTKFGLQNDNPALFVNSQWCGPVGQLCWVIFWTLYYVAILALDVYYDQDAGATWFIYLTNLTYLVQAALVFTDCIVTVYVHIKRRDIRDGQTEEIAWYIRLLWVIFNVSNCCSILVTVLYYALLSPTFNHGSINKHLLNSVYTILLLLFTAKPVQILHFYQSMVYAALYIIFSAIYQESGNDAIYGPLDWDKPGNTIVVVALSLFLGIPAVHLFCFALYTLRIWIWRKIHSKSVSIETENKNNLEMANK